MPSLSNYLNYTPHFFPYALDILILSFLTYQTYKVLYQARALQITHGLFFFLALYALAYFLNLSLLLWLFNGILAYFVPIIAILYQTEIRQVLSSFDFRLPDAWAKQRKFSTSDDIRQVVQAATYLSMKKKGALICFVDYKATMEFIKGGVPIGADITSELLISIFEYETPLHDGGVLIEGEKILLAGCLLPLSHQEDLSQHFGTRHRAALGLSEVTKSVVLVVSEETGAISLAYAGKLDYNLDAIDLFERLSLVLLEYKKNNLQRNTNGVISV